MVLGLQRSNERSERCNDAAFKRSEKRSEIMAASARVITLYFRADLCII